jgi:parallel beta-helix repeat protein
MTTESVSTSKNTADQIMLGAVGVTLRPLTECVTTITDLKALGSGITPCLTVLGYHVPGDGGGGNFFWDSAFTVDLKLWPAGGDGGIVIRPNELPPSAAGRWRRRFSSDVSVKWFGAIGNGCADDTTAIQAAIDTTKATAALHPNQNAVVYFPPGKYKITNFLNITASVPLTLQGDGDLSEIVIWNTDDGLAAQASSAPLVIRRLRFSGSYARAIMLSSATSTTEIDHCNFSGATRMPASGPQSPIFIIAQNDVWITNNYIHGCGEQGAKSARTYAIGSDTLPSDMYRWHISGNTILGAGTTVQIALFDLSDSAIINNVIDGGGRSAIWDGYADGYGILIYRTHSATSPQGNRVSGNTVKNCAGSGIYLQDVPNTIVGGNVVTDCALAMSSRTSLLVASIVAVIGANALITSNVIKGGNRRGIAVQSNGAKIVGNVITGTAEHAILIDAAVTRNVVAGNTVDTTRGSVAELLGSTAPGFAVTAGEQVEIKIDATDTVTTTFGADDKGSLHKIVYRINQAFATVGFPAPAVGVNAAGIGAVHDTLLLQSTQLGPDAAVQVVGGSEGTLAKLGLTTNRVSGSSGQHGIYCAAAVTACTITQNVIRSIQGQGITLPAGGSGATISENYVTECPNAQAYMVLGGSNNVIAHNHAVNNANYGFDLRCSGSLIQGNHAHGNGGIGMLLIGGSDNRLLDNDCTGNSEGNLLDRATNTTRAGNVVASQAAARAGIATLKAGKQWIANREVILSSRLRLTRKTAGGSLGHLSYSLSAGVGFTITSSDSGDTSEVEWELIH